MQIRRMVALGAAATAVALVGLAGLPASAGTSGAKGASCLAIFENSATSDLAVTSHNGGCGLVSLRMTYAVPGQGTVVNSQEFWARSSAAGTYGFPYATPELVRSRHSVVIYGLRYNYNVSV